VANTVRFSGCTLADVLPLASTQPAAAVGQSTAGRVLARWDPAAFTLTVEEVRA
jgi:N-acetylglucosamine-6-phosphate deacetylase